MRRAGLRDLRFHDLRHTFGTQVIATASILKVKEWMGHVDVDTTMRYLHFAPSEADAELVAQAFAPKPPDPLAPAAAYGRVTRRSASHASTSLR